MLKQNWTYGTSMAIGPRRS